MVSLTHSPRTPGRVVLACAAAVVVCFVAAAVDFKITGSRVPPVPPLCEPSTTECNNARNAKFAPRLEAARELEADYDGRAWLYSLAAVVALAIATAGSLRSRDSVAERRRVFTNLGTAGVSLGLLTVVLIYLSNPGLVDPPAWPAFFPAIASVAGAAVGGLVMRLEAPGAEPEAAPLSAWYRAARVGGLVLTAATLVLAWSYISAQPACGGGDAASAPGWTNAVGVIALLTAGGAALFGLLALVLRRWVTALICFAANPTLLLFMLASSCAFD
jgi:hypothetical protein